MNDMTMETGTALALPEPASLAAMLSTKGGTDPVVGAIEAHVSAESATLSPETKAGRDAMKSLAYKVSKTKVEFERQAGVVKEDAQKLVNSVNAELRTVTSRLDALRDATKKPALDWEAADEARKDRLKLRLDAFRPSLVPSNSEGLRALIAEVEAVTVDETWQEFQADARDAKALCLNRLDEHLANAVERERIAAEAEAKAIADAAEKKRLDAEIAELRAEKAARDEADRIKAEADAAEARRITDEKAAAERKRIADERAEAARVAAVKAEAERQAKIEADILEAAKQAAEAAHLKAKADADRAAQEAADREAALQRQIDEQKAAAEQAAQNERDRIAAERQAEANARAKREADQAHSQRIRDDIATSMNGFTDELTAGLIADAIMDGAIPFVQVML